jgi:L-alanine-DL-glutamate epimerase-like enolase superfamily enzyme
MGELTIERIEGIACSVPLAAPVTIGLGQVLKREAVVIKVTTASGLVGYGEAHHCRAPRAVEALVNSTIRELVVGRDASETTAIWEHVYRNQLATHGMGSAAACALSGVDTALWDIRGKATDWPLYRLLGGTHRPIPAYAGGVALGYQEPAALADEALLRVEQGFTALKLRVGQGFAIDVARMRAVRDAVGQDVAILTDANAQCAVADVLRALPVYEELGIGWLEEPFAPQDRRAYREVARWSRIPLAAGENHYTRYEFGELIEDGAVGVLQPDVSKCGGVTEMMRIAALAATAGLPVCPHTSITAINMAATIHLIASMPTGGYFEADLANGNLLRTRLGTTAPYEVSATGQVEPLAGPGLGIEVDEEFLRAHPLTPGPAFVPLAA